MGVRGWLRVIGTLILGTAITCALFWVARVNLTQAGVGMVLLVVWGATGLLGEER